MSYVGLKEFGEPTRKALIMDLAPEERKAAVFGLYYMLRDIVVSIAAFGGAFLWMISPTVNFLTAFAFGVIGTVGYALWGRDIDSSTAKSSNDRSNSSECTESVKDSKSKILTLITFCRTFLVFLFVVIEVLLNPANLRQRFGIFAHTGTVPSTG